MSLPYYRQKIKDTCEKYQDSVFGIGIVLISNTLLFGIGYLCAMESDVSGIVSTSFPLPNSIVPQKALNMEMESDSLKRKASRSIVASRNGTKYYFRWCSGVSRIKEENKVWFETTKEAEDRGYEPSKNCVGL